MEQLTLMRFKSTSLNVDCKIIVNIVSIMSLVPLTISKSGCLSLPSKLVLRFFGIFGLYGLSRDFLLRTNEVYYIRSKSCTKNKLPLSLI